MKFQWLAAPLTALLLAASQSASSVPLRLDYSIADLGGGMFNYEFTLVVDDNDGTYAPGQGWRWFIFGDEPFPGSSPLTDFVGDPSDLPIGPWTMYISSSGGHNGPTLGPVLDFWVPAGIGDSLSWSGTSTAFLPQGQLLWSTIAGTLDNAVAADFEIANKVPEPVTILLLGLGLAGLGFARRQS